MPRTCAFKFSEIASPAASSPAWLILDPLANFSSDRSKFCLVIDICLNAFSEVTFVEIRKPILASVHSATLLDSSPLSIVATSNRAQFGYVWLAWIAEPIRNPVKPIRYYFYREGEFIVFQ